LLPLSGFEDPRKTSLSLPPHSRLGQSLCISPPIVHRPFEFPSSSVFSLSILRRTLLSCLSVSRVFVFLSRLRRLSRRLSPHIPDSLRLFQVFRYFRYRVCFLFRFGSRSFPPYPHPTFRLLFLRPLGYPFFCTRFCVSPVILLHLPSLSSFVFYFPSTRLFSVSTFVFRLLALSIPVPSFVISSSSFILSSSFGIPAFRLSSFVFLVFCSMVQPASFSAILILIGLGFRLYSRQSISSAQPVLLLSTFVPTQCASSSSHSSFPVNRLPSSSSSLSMSMSPRFRHCLSYSAPDPCSHPFSGFMAPLRILGRSLSSSVSAIVLFSQSSSFRRNLDSSQHHRLFLS